MYVALENDKYLQSVQKTIHYLVFVHRFVYTEPNTYCVVRLIITELRNYKCVDLYHLDRHAVGTDIHAQINLA